MSVDQVVANFGTFLQILDLSAAGVCPSIRLLPTSAPIPARRALTRKRAVSVDQVVANFGTMIVSYYTIGTPYVSVDQVVANFGT